MRWSKLREQKKKKKKRKKKSRRRPKITLVEIIKKWIINQGNNREYEFV